MYSKEIRALLSQKTDVKQALQPKIAYLQPHVGGVYDRFIIFLFKQNDAPPLLVVAVRPAGCWSQRRCDVQGCTSADEATGRRD